jgi:hypothetical protein
MNKMEEPVPDVSEEDKKKMNQTEGSLDLSIRVTMDNYKQDEASKVARLRELGTDLKQWTFMKNKDVRNQ